MKSRLQSKIFYLKLLFRITTVILISMCYSVRLSAQNLNSQADSLSYCGYFDQELILRKAILEKDEADKDLIKANKIMLDLTNYNLNGDKKSNIEQNIEYLLLLKSYLASNIKTRKLIAVEIGRLIANELKYAERYEESISLFKKILKTLNNESVDAATINLNIAQTLLNKQRLYFDAIPFFKASIDGFEKNEMGNHYINALAISDLSFAYDRGEIEHEMMECSIKAHEIWSKYYYKDAEIVSNSYNNLLSDIVDYGDKFGAKKYQLEYDNFINKFLKDGKQNYLATTNDFRVLGLYYLSVVRYYDMNFNAQKLTEAVASQEALFKRASEEYVKKEKSVLLSTYDNVSHAYYMNYDTKKAITFNNLMEQNADSDFYRMKAEANRAMLYYYNYDYTKASIHTQKSLDYLELLGFKSSFKTLLVLKAEVLANLGKFDESKATLNQLFELNFEKGFKYQNLSFKDYKEVASSSDINILIHAGLAYKTIYEKNGRQKEDLKIMKNFYTAASKMFKKYYQKGYFNSSLERQLGNIKEGLLYGAVQDQKDVQFGISSIDAIENGQSQHLWKQFLAKNEENMRVPKTTLDKKNAVQLKINYLENIKEISSEDSLELITQNNNLEKIENDIQESNLQYQQYSTFDFETINLQKNLDSNDIILKYVLTDSSVFGIKISSKGVDIKKLGTRKSLESKSKEYYQALSKLNYDFSNSSQELYKKLVAPFEINQRSKLRIITEGFLNYLPFESLKTSKNNFLAQNYSISYANGLKFLTLNDEKQKTNFIQNFAGFAPEYSQELTQTRAENGTLIYTGKELQKIVETLGNGTIYLKNEATKSKFLSSIGKSNIHHLAMHSVLDENDYNYSSLVFQDNEKLFFKEIYDLNFPSEMVVLSACNTGIGQLLSGEGLMSMSRALNYAGVKSTIYSLWQVPDKETSDLMVLFYENIDKGLSKDQALAEAKRIFIKKYSTKSHPYFWAGFVVNGDLKPIEKNTNYWKILFFGVFCIIIVLITKKWFFYKK